MADISVCYGSRNRGFTQPSSQFMGNLAAIDVEFEEVTVAGAGKIADTEAPCLPEYITGTSEKLAQSLRHAVETEKQNCRTSTD